MLNLITPAVLTPVSVSELKTHLHITGTAYDTYLTTLIQAATEYCEDVTGRSFCPQTWELVGKCFPIQLPSPPTISITSIEYYDENDELQTWSSEEYRLHKSYRGYSRIEPVDCHPDLSCDRLYPVTTTWVAGYVTQVPYQVKQAINLIGASWNENREEEVVGASIARVQLGVLALLDNLIVRSYYV